MCLGNSVSSAPGPSRPKRQWTALEPSPYSLDRDRAPCRCGSPSPGPPLLRDTGCGWLQRVRGPSLWPAPGADSHNPVCGQERPFPAHLTVLMLLATDLEKMETIVSVRKEPTPAKLVGPGIHHQAVGRERKNEQPLRFPGPLNLRPAQVHP